jgi:hypothetical protein
MIALPTLKCGVLKASSGVTAYRAPIVSSHSGVVNAATSYYPMGGDMTASATLANMEVPFYLAATFKNLRCYVTANSSSTSTTFRLIKNGSATALTLTIGSGATGLFEDSSNSVTITSTDKFCYEVVRGSAENMTFTNMTVDYLTPAGSMKHIVTGAGVGYANASQTRFNRPVGGITIVTGESGARSSVPCGFTARNLAVYVSANGRSSTSTVQIRKNNADTGVIISIGSGATGWFTDTSNSVAFSEADQITIGMTNGIGSGTVAFRTISWESDATTTGLAAQFMGFNGVNLTSANSPRHSPLAAQQIDITTSATANYRTVMRGGGVIKKLYCETNSNAATTSTTYSVQVGGSDTSVLAVLPTVTTGVFSDTSNTYTYANGDSMGAQFSRGGTGAHTVGSLSFAMEITSETL